MKKRIFNIVLTVFTVFMLVILLPVHALAANTNDKIQVTDQGTVTISSSHGAAEGISSLQLSLRVEPMDQNAKVSFAFSDSAAKIAEFRYHEDSGLLNIYLAGTKALFEESDTLSVGTVVVQNQDGRDVRATVSVEKDSLKYVYGTELKTEEAEIPEQPVIINADQPTDQETAQMVTDQIEALHGVEELAFADQKSIEAARSAYDALTDAQKAYVPAKTTEKLASLEQKLADMQKQVDNVAKLIEALPKISDLTMDDAKQVAEAQAAYDALSQDQKNRLPENTASVLLAAKNRIAQLQQTDIKDGLSDKKDADGNWYYYTDQKVNTDYIGVAKNKNGWWYVKNGKVDFNYTGFGTNENGDWYIENGKVTFQKNSVIKDLNGALGSKGIWYYVVGSEVTYVDTVAKNENGWWRIANGKVDFNCNSVEKNENGWWYIRGGKVDFQANTVAKNKNGWWYVEGGKVQFAYTGVANYKNEHGWWYVKNGKVDFDYMGIASNKHGTWYIKAGKVQFGYAGRISVDGKIYEVRNGRVI